MKDNLKGIGIWGQRHYEHLKATKPSVIGVMRMNGSPNAYLQQVNEPLLLGEGRARFL